MEQKKEAGNDEVPADIKEDSSAAWLLTQTGTMPRVPASFHPLAAEWQNIADRERKLGIAPGTPVLVAAELVDDRLNVYFRHSFGRDQMSTAMTYAFELRQWMAFLGARDVRWDEARREDVRAFQSWRVYDEENSSRVTPATWNKGWAALKHFYGWARDEGWVDSDPVGQHDRLRDPSAAGGYREKNARGSRDRWLTPGEYKMWRDVGFRGYNALVVSGNVVAGLPNEVFRGRNIARNAAFTDYVLSSGLRLEESGSLLAMEIPASVGDNVPIIGKGKIFRHYKSLHRSGLDAVQAYVDGERKDVIRRAQRLGRYDQLKNRLVITEVLPGRRGHRIRVNDRRPVYLPMLTSQERRRLFVV